MLAFPGAHPAVADIVEAGNERYNRVGIPNDTSQNLIVPRRKCPAVALAFVPRQAITCVMQIIKQVM
jgi:hypothetical protein